MKYTILPDTSFLLQLEKVDVFTALEDAMQDPHEIVIIEPVLGELELLAKSGKKAEKMIAKVVIELIKRKGLKIKRGFSTDRHVDDLLTELSSGDVLVATQDKGLKQRIQTKGNQIITLRQRKYVVMD